MKNPKSKQIRNIQNETSELGDDCDDIFEECAQENFSNQIDFESFHSEHNEAVVRMRLRQRSVIRTSKCDDYIMKAQDFVSQRETPMNDAEGINSTEKEAEIYCK